MNIHSLCAHWVALHEGLGIGTPILEESHYHQVLDVIEPLMNAARHDTSGSIYGLIELLADRIREYENRVHPWPEGASPAGILQFLMEQHGLSQSQVPEVGSQGVVSEVLRGKRELNVRQITALSGRFGVDAGVFLPKKEQSAHA